MRTYLNTYSVRLAFASLLLAVLTLASGFSFAGNPKEASSLLWKIEGKGLQKPSYLFGTVHMICSENFVMPEKVKKAIQQTGQTYLEIDLSSPNFAAESQKYMMSERSISSQISKQDSAFVDSVMIVKLGVSLAQYNQVKPMILVAAIMRKIITCPLVSFESEIIKLTAEKSHKVQGLSSIEEQYSFLEKVFDTKDLPAFLKDIDHLEMSDVFAKIYKYYKVENLAGINELVAEFSTTNPEGYRQLLPVRNHLWADRIPAIIKNTPTFIGIGCGHLSGEEGIINLLRKKGYKVTPVLN
ncbi:MAG TPA: TraB/GumN family protein [Daejeonella sp.]|nr:TraB/GumN family protein [Daejeonella sp.]